MLSCTALDITVTAARCCWLCMLVALSASCVHQGEDTDGPDPKAERVDTDRIYDYQNYCDLGGVTFHNIPAYWCPLRISLNCVDLACAA